MTAKVNSAEETTHILIVEDSPTQGEKLKFLLEHHAYKATLVTDGRQALAYLSQNTPTLIITDIIMPEMNGYELCQKIKANENTKDIPVILLTSLSSTQDVLEGLACGADNFISKPYSERYLLSNIAGILVNAKLRRTEHVRFGMEVQFDGKKRFITANQQQMLSMLISTYEAAVNRNNELLQSQSELRAVNERLEELVDERTAALMAEVAAHKKAEEEIRKLNDNLEKIISERTVQLKDTIAQLEELNRVFVGRELKMIELKNRIAELESRPS